MSFLIQLKRNAIAEWHFCTKLKRNLTSAIKISQHYTNTAFFAILDRKRVNNMLKSPTFTNITIEMGTKLSSMHRIALLTEKHLKAQQILRILVRNATFAMFQAQCYFRNCGGCALPTSKYMEHLTLFQ